MSVLEGVSLCLVLLLALYGCAQATVRLVQRILRPHKPKVSLVLSVCEKDDLEQQVRYARWLSLEWSIPICVDGCELDDEGRHIVSVLLKEKYR